MIWLSFLVKEVSNDPHVGGVCVYVPYVKMPETVKMCVFFHFNSIQRKSFILRYHSFANVKGTCNANEW